MKLYKAKLDFFSSFPQSQNNFFKFFTYTDLGYYFCNNLNEREQIELVIFCWILKERKNKRHQF